MNRVKDNRQPNISTPDVPNAYKNNDQQRVTLCGRRRSRHSRTTPYQRNSKPNATPSTYNTLMSMTNLSIRPLSDQEERHHASGDIIKCNNPRSQDMMDALDDIIIDLDNKQRAEKTARKRRLSLGVEELYGVGKGSKQNAAQTSLYCEASTSKYHQTVPRQTESDASCEKRRKVEISLEGAPNIHSVKDTNKRKCLKPRPNCHKSNQECDNSEPETLGCSNKRIKRSNCPKPRQDCSDTEIPSCSNNDTEVPSCSNKDKNPRPNCTESSQHCDDVGSPSCSKKMKKVVTEEPAGSTLSEDTCTKRQYNWFHDSFYRSGSTEKPKWKENSFFVTNSKDKRSVKERKDDVVLQHTAVKKLNINCSAKPYLAVQYDISDELNTKMGCLNLQKPKHQLLLRLIKENSSQTACNIEKRQTNKYSISCLVESFRSLSISDA